MVLLFVFGLRRRDVARGMKHREAGVRNYAHRGGAANAPENTIFAFERGVEAGADGLEMDVQISGDGELFVIHDDMVDRTTNGSGVIRAMNREEIARLDAGHRFEGTAGIGVCIPTFREVLRRFPENFINVEIKSDSPEAVGAMLDALSECDAFDRTIVASASQGKMNRLRRESRRRVRARGEPRVMTSATLPEIAVFSLAARLGLEALVPTPYVALQVPVEYRGITVVTRRFVRAAHSVGVRVDVWTVDEAEEMRRLERLGVDGIMTDRPDVLSEVLSQT